MFELFEDDDARTAGDDEAVAVDVIGARGGGRRVVLLR